MDVKHRQPQNRQRQIGIYSSVKIILILSTFQVHRTVSTFFSKMSVAYTFLVKYYSYKPFRKLWEIHKFTNLIEYKKLINAHIKSQTALKFITEVDFTIIVQLAAKTSTHNKSNSRKRKTFNDLQGKEITSLLTKKGQLKRHWQPNLKRELNRCLKELHIALEQKRRKINFKNHYNFYQRLLILTTSNLGSYSIPEFQELLLLY